MAARRVDAFCTCLGKAIWCDVCLDDMRKTYTEEYVQSAVVARADAFCRIFPTWAEPVQQAEVARLMVPCHASAPIATGVMERITALELQNQELFKAQSANAERIAALVADRAALQAEVARLMDDLRKLYAKAAHPDPEPETRSSFGNALTHGWASSRFPTDRN